jgi:CRP-like cAMP-binding protein
MATRHPLQTGNLLLEQLSAADLDLLAPAMRLEPMPRLLRMFAAGEPIEQVWFPHGSVASVVVLDDERKRQTEVGIVGGEGFTGGVLLLGSDVSPYECYVQIEGQPGHCLPRAAFMQAVDQSPSLRTLLLRYVHTFMVQVAQSADSNAQQRMEARLARWLLMCHDRVAGDDIEITHQFMSTMIAAERTSVTVTLHILEGAGLIRSTRGRVLIIDRTGLEQLAHEGYGRPEAEYRRLIGPFGKSTPGAA